MTTPGPSSHSTRGEPSLGRLRLRLTIWYGGTSLLIAAVLGTAMFATLTRRLDRDLDLQLTEAAKVLAQVSSARGGTAAVDQLHMPDRTLIVTDSLGRAIAPQQVAPWLTTLAHDAWKHGAHAAHYESNATGPLRAFAEPVHASNEPGVAIAMADEIELEDRYASLIAAFSAAAVGTIILVTIGGWIVARQSAEPVERTIEYMRRFMADAAHELRTPLTVLRSRAEVALQRSRTSDDYETALHSIEREAERLGHIVEDLLTLARADVGERLIARQRVFLDDVTLDAAEAARALAERKSIRVEIEDFEEAPVLGDPTLLRQLVLIFLDNAIKFTAQGGLVRVAIRDENGRATLVVTDNGEGISANHLPHLFERFYRGDPSRTRATTGDGGTEGAGLGLSIAKWIADEHGGTIDITSTPGQGTRVAAQFPLAAAEQVSSS